MSACASDPFVMSPQTVLSCSGGRTSMYMLWRVLQSNGGKLPPTVVPVFCNTGKEHEATLQFVEECSQRWGVPIRWLEYRYEPGRHCFVEVDFRTASRNGEPLRYAIQARCYLPNPVARFCTVETKIRTSNCFVRQKLGWPEYFNAVGLRADEPKRVHRLTTRKIEQSEVTLFGVIRKAKSNGTISAGESPICPLATAGIVNQDVLDFWANHPFDLNLPVDERSGRTKLGNCDLCFLKGASTLIKIIREEPERADWWIESETLIQSGGRAVSFRADRPPYAELKRIALGQVDEPGWLWADREGDACGEITECACTD